MFVRTFNVAGMTAFNNFLDELIRGNANDVTAANLADDRRLTETYSPRIDFDPPTLPNKKALAKSVADAFADAGVRDLPLEPTETNTGLWTWLCAATFRTVRSRPTLGSKEYYIINPSNFRLRWYRHRIAGPTRIYWLFRENPEDANLLLNGVAHQHSDDLEQFASRQYTALNRPVLAAANRLYFNAIGFRRKPGRQDRTRPGTIRHYISVIQQLQLTYDLQSMTPEQILDLLPPAFDRWRD